MTINAFHPLYVKTINPTSCLHRINAKRAACSQLDSSSTWLRKPRKDSKPLWQSTRLP